jgi:hypothetical protein
MPHCFDLFLVVTQQPGNIFQIFIKTSVDKLFVMHISSCKSDIKIVLLGVIESDSLIIVIDGFVGTRVQSSLQLKRIAFGFGKP